MLTAIIIDDELKGRIALKQKLHDYCPQVKLVGEASSAAEGLALIEKDHPDIVFLDIEMPMMNGFEMLHHRQKVHLVENTVEETIDVPVTNRVQKIRVVETLVEEFEDVEVPVTRLIQRVRPIEREVVEEIDVFVDQVIQREVVRDRDGQRHQGNGNGDRHQGDDNRGRQDRQHTGKGGKRDDLTRIEGIGPKIAELLIARGITTFEELERTPKATIQTILDAGGRNFQTHDPSTWSQQSGMAARGEWDTLKKWQDELDGGKVK